jgi:hypothetical protein
MVASAETQNNTHHEYQLWSISSGSSTQRAELIAHDNPNRTYISGAQSLFLRLMAAAFNFL